MNLKNIRLNRRKVNRKGRTAMARSEVCFHFLIGLITTIMLYVFSFREPKKKHLPEYTNSRMQELIAEHIHSERDRALISKRLLDHICFEPLSEEFGLSVRQTKKIVYRCEKVLFAHL